MSYIGECGVWKVKIPTTVSGASNSRTQTGTCYFSAALADTDEISGPGRANRNAGRRLVRGMRRRRLEEWVSTIVA
jgi:hypothetical protein